MKTVLHLLVQLVKTLGVPVALVLTGFHFAYRYGILFGYPAWILAAVWIAFPIAGLLAGPVVGFLFSYGTFDKPQPAYSIPESLRMKNKLAEALQAYQALAEKFPQEVRPWAEMIRLAHVDMKDTTLAEQLLSRGLAKLRKRKKREELERIARAVMSLSQEAPTAESRRRIQYPEKKS